MAYDGVESATHTPPGSDITEQYRLLRDKLRETRARHAHMKQELRQLPKMTPKDIPVNKAYRDGWNALHKLVIGIVDLDEDSRKAP